MGNRFSSLLASDIRRQPVSRMRGYRHWRWHLHEEGETKLLQKFTSVHASIANHFNLECHLVDRQTFKQRRSAALAEWKSFVS